MKSNDNKAVKKVRKAPEGAVRSEQSEQPRPYNLNYGMDWERLFEDTAKMFDPAGPFKENDLKERKHLGDAWKRITKESLVPPEDLYRADRWKRTRIW